MPINSTSNRFGSAGWSSVLAACSACTIILTGCGPHYRQLRIEGQTTMVQGDYGSAKRLLMNAEIKGRRKEENLNDMAVCSVMVAQRKFDEMNVAAAMRELDAAIANYNAALDECPGHQPSIEGKGIALKMKGRFAEAMKHAQWASTNVGPSARQSIFLAKEMEYQGDLEGAYLKYQQAVVMEPRNFEARTALAGFLIRFDNQPAALVELEEAYRLHPKDQWVAEQLNRLQSRRPMIAARHLEEMP